VYSTELLSNLESLFASLESTASEEVLAEGIPAEQIEPPLQSLDMRYQGVEATINVPRPDDGDYSRRYEQLHQQLYGYTHEDRALEVTAARVELVGTIADPPEQTIPPVPRTPSPSKTSEVRFAGRSRLAGVFLREKLHPGDEIVGPAIVCEPTSTVVIDPGFSATVTSRGEILIADETTGRGTDSEAAEDAADSTALTAADPVMLEIFNNLFASIAEQMGITLARTSFSTNVKERLDFSCAIFSPEGDLVVNAPHIPVHLGAMSETVQCILADNPDLVQGDVFVTNDPYRGGSHLPDITVVTPVHHPQSRALLFFTASRAHHAELGGIVPGSMPPFSKRLADEGILIRNFKLITEGASQEEELRQLLGSGDFPSRSIADNMADISAQVAANNSGVRQLAELVTHYSLPVVQAYMRHIQRAASEKMRFALEKIADGRYQRTDHLDDGSPIAVTITIRGDTATVGFTGTAGVLTTNLNANRAIVTAAVLYVFRCLIDEEIPLNSGVLDPVNIILPECLLNPPARDDPADCAAVVGGNVETSQRVVDTLLGALGVAAASQGTMNNLTFGDATFGYYETICGGSGATPVADGADAVHTHMTNTRLTDVEVLERRYPVRVQEFSIRHGSGGTGRQRGGDGVVRRIEFLRRLNVSMLSERRGEYAPFGLTGGLSGKIGCNHLRQKGASAAEDLGGKFAIVANAGDVLTIKTPGGGGYGNAGE
jgi:5-oxoprolinase (ATP-hydrolysing)